MTPAAESWRRFYRPMEAAAWITLAGALLLAFMLPLSSADLYGVLIFLVLVAAYILGFFHWVLPRFGDRAWVHAIVTFINVSIIGVADWFYGRQGVGLELIYAVVVVMAGITSGPRRAAYAGALATAYAAIATFASRPVGPAELLSLVLRLAGFVLLGVASGYMADTIRKQNSAAVGRNRELALLLDANRTVTASLNLYATLPALAEKIARGLPATFCRICLLDDLRGHLITYGVHPIRELTGLNGALGKRCVLDELPRHLEAVRSGNPVIVRQDSSSLCMEAAECASLLFAEMKSACLVPIKLGADTLGVICVGEARSWERQPFDEGKIELLRALSNEIAVVINNSQLHQVTQRQVDRMAVLSEVGRAISSTIELDDLLELIYRQLSRVIRTDTYYVGIFDPAEDSLDLSIIFDENRRFPSRKIALGDGLVSIVIRERRPLLVRHLTKEVATLPVKPVVVGKEKLSESWLGVPIVAGEHLLGALAVASYEPQAFNEADVELLLNIAGQAALALDNAGHHAQVEEQAKTDSLTGAYNHGHLLRRLEDEVAVALRDERPVSLIMLDIDRFKMYNDKYGHVVGDSALCLTVRAIRAHIKKTDTVGRWGGEEFGIVLPGASAAEAAKVAQRIRETLASLDIQGMDGERLPSPTVSQGIAACPLHASQAARLVDLADRALYRAKERGRDQVELAAS